MQIFRSGIKGCSRRSGGWGVGGAGGGVERNKRRQDRSVEDMGTECVLVSRCTHTENTSKNQEQTIKRKKKRKKD